MTGRVAYALTEHQFEELRVYESGDPVWQATSPSANLIRRGCLDRTDVRTFCITEYGRAQLKAFREEHGIPEPTPRTDALLAYREFMAMGEQAWYHFLTKPENIAGLTPPEREGFEQAARARVRKAREQFG